MRKISSFRRVLKGSSFTFGQGLLYTVGWKARASISYFKRVYSEKSFTSTINVKYLPRDTRLLQTFTDGKFVQFFVLQAVCIFFEDSVIAITLRLGYQKIQANWFHLGVRIVHLLHADVTVFDPTVHAGTMDERVRVNRIRVLY